MVVAALVNAAFSQSFGRFGYARNMVIPGFIVDVTGFKVNCPAADQFKFVIPSIEWTPLATSAYAQTVRLAGAGGSPMRIKAESWAVGFSMYVEKGLSLKLSSALSPYLSWEEGSVGADVPMPPARWALVSFRDSQPPILLCFLNGPGELVVKGESGNFTLSTTKPYKGWIRVIAPFGTTPKPASTAKMLGELTNSVKKQVTQWLDWPAQLKKVDVIGDSLGVQATWTFDKPGAVLPHPCLLAPLGGYPLKLKSEYEKLEMVTEEGPVCVAKGNEIVIRFPIRRVPTGRSLPLGASAADLIGSASSLDIASVSELALSNLNGSRDALTRTAGEETLSQYLTESTYTQEPYTKQQLPYDAAGKGGDLCAAHALLMQSLYSTISASSEPNALLTSLGWRRDAYTWLYWSPDATLTRRTGALASLAGALCPEPERRLEGALFEAGVAAQRGLSTWHRRREEIEKEPVLIDPLWAQRASIFNYDATGTPLDPFVQSLLSEIRVYGDHEVTLTKEGDSLRLKWKALDSRPMTVTLAAAYPLELKAISLFDYFSAKEALGFTVIRCNVKDPCACEVEIKKPEWTGLLPAIAPIPRYSETLR